MNSRNLGKTWLRRLAILVVIAMLTSMVPVSALAEDVTLARLGGNDIVAMDVTNHINMSVENLGANVSGEEDQADRSPEEEDEDDVFEFDFSDGFGEDGEQEPPAEEGYYEDEQAEEPQAPMENPEDNTAVVTGFGKLQKTDYRLTHKVEMDVLMDYFPKSLSATFEGQEEDVELHVTWKNEDYESSAYGSFEFVPLFTDEGVWIDNRLVAISDVLFDVEVVFPVIRVDVLAITGFEPLEADFVALDEKPESVGKAVEALHLPDVLMGTLSDSENLQAFPVRWESDDFEDQDADTFNLRAAFSDTQYSLAEGVAMPQIIVQIPDTQIEQTEEVEVSEEIMNTADGRFEPFVVEVEDVDEVKKTISISGWLGNGTSLDIPDHIEDYEVIAIKDGAFASVNCSALTTIRFPDTIRKFGDDLFADVEKITSVVFKVTRDTVLKKDETEGYLYNSGFGSVNFPLDNTDFDIVVIKGKLTVECDYTVEKDHRIDVKNDGQLIIADATEFVNNGTIVVEEEAKAIVEKDAEFSNEGIIEINGEDGFINRGVMTNHNKVKFLKDGSLVNDGTFYNCKKPDSIDQTKIKNKHIIVKHSFQADGKCMHCNAKELHVALIEEHEPTRKYDGTTNVYNGDPRRTLKVSDFEITNLEEDENVSLTRINKIEFDNKDAGKRTIIAEFSWNAGTTPAYDYILETQKFIGGGTIEPLEVIVTPQGGNKVYGDKEKEEFFSFSGEEQLLDEEDKFTGKLSRVASENVGRHKITKGDLDAGGNYDIVVADAYVTITPRRIDDKDVRLTPILPQAYTGSRVEPAVTLTYKDYTLVRNTDYTVVYSNNIEAGEGAVATIRGVNNFDSGSQIQALFTIDKAIRKVIITLKKGHNPNKPYDGTDTVIGLHAKSDFDVTNVAAGDLVQITSFKSEYETIHAGKQNISIHDIVLSQNGTNYTYQADPFTIEGTITAKPLTITPVVDKSKVYVFTYQDVDYVIGMEVTGLLDVDEITGKLAPAKTEAGTHKIVKGTIVTRNKETKVENEDYEIVINEAYLTINPKPIGDKDIIMDDIPVQTYTGEKIEPDVKLSYEGHTLEKGTDYEVEYRNNTDAGTATVVITGKKNFTGKREKDFLIEEESLDEVTIEEVPIQEYTGHKIEPELVLKCGDDTLKRGIDYTVEFSNNVEIGDAKFVVTGIGNYEGTDEGTFKIVKRSANHLTLVPIPNQKYTGEEIEPVIILMNGDIVLLEGEDFDVTYSNNVNVGTARVTITGKGDHYEGTRTDYFIIEEIQKTDRKLTFQYIGSARKLVKIYDGTRNISLNKSDFAPQNVASGDSVTIAGISARYENINAGYPRKIIVSFSFTQSSARYNYYMDDLVLGGETYQDSIALDGRINRKELVIRPTTTSKVYGTSDVIKYEVEGLLSIDGVAGTLAPISEDSGRRRIIDNGLYTYDNHTKTKNENYDIILTEAYITISQKSLSDKESIAILPSPILDQVYTGSEIKPTITSVIYYKDKPFEPENVDYKVSYSNNVEIGTATVTISPMSTNGNYCDSQKVYFKILKSMSDKSIKLTVQSPYTYSRGVIVPKITVMDGSKTLGSDDYEIIGYSQRGTEVSPENAGTYTVTIGGKGDYTGRISGTFTIVPKNITDTDMSASLEKTSYSYDDGKAQTPNATVTWKPSSGGSHQLSRGTEFDISYFNNKGSKSKEITAVARIYGMGNYTGAVELEFTIAKGSGSSSGGSSSGSSTEEDDDDETEEEDVEDQYYGYTFETEDGTWYLLVDTTNKKAELYRSDVDEYMVGDFTGNLRDGITVKFRDSDESAYITLSAEGDYSNISFLMDGEDKTMEQGTWSDVDAIIAPHRNPPKGIIKIDGENLGTVLFGDDYQPKALKQELENITDPDLAGKRRLIIEVQPEVDAAGQTIYLNPEQTRARYAPTHLRLTNDQIDQLKWKNIAEIVVKFEKAEMRIPLDKLTKEIDLNKITPPVVEKAAEVEPEAAEEAEAEPETEPEAVEEAEPETEVEPEAEEEAEPEAEAQEIPADGDEDFEEIEDNGLTPMAAVDEEFEEVDETAEADETAETEETTEAVETVTEAPVQAAEYVPLMQVVDLYDFHFEQVFGPDSLTSRETGALTDMQALLPMYRVEANAMAGRFPDMTPQDEVEQLEDDEDVPVVAAEPVEYDMPLNPDVQTVARSLAYAADVGVSAVDDTATAPRKVYFSLNVLSTSAEIETAERVIEAGVYGGGVVEIYDTIGEAQNRDSALTGFDGTMFSEAHQRLGSCVVRLSSRLNDAEDAAIMQGIIQVLTASAPTNVEKKLEYTLPRIFPVMRVLNLVEEEGNPLGDEEWESDVDESEAEMSVGNVPMRIRPNDEGRMLALPEDAKLLYVSDDVELTDAEAVTTTVAQYTTDPMDVNDGYAEFYPQAAGLYGVVQPIPVVEEVPETPVEEPVETAPAVTPEPAEPVPTPEPAPQDDPEPMYAYERRSNEGNMYWLVNNQDKTMEFYREDTKSYRIGDSTGSLISGMTVQFRDDEEMVNVKLKFQETYKFALFNFTDVDGSSKELLMEQVTLDKVEEIMRGVRK